MGDDAGIMDAVLLCVIPIVTAGLIWFWVWKGGRTRRK